MYAQWTKTPVWTVVYDANGGGGTMLDSTAPAGEGLKLKANEFTRTGCGFAGWAENKDGTPSILTVGTSIAGKPAGKTLTLYAQWTVTNPADVVNEALTKGDGTAVTLTGVAWNGIKSALESALYNSNITTLDLAGVSGLTTWDTSTLNMDINDKARITSLALPDTVTSLPDESYTGAFYGYTNLTSVSGAGVTTIGTSAFLGCAALKTVSLPAATTIGGAAFLNTPLEMVSLPAAKDIRVEAFANCTLLETVSLPAVENIGNGAFSRCTKLTDLYLPATPPTLAASVFEDTDNSGTLKIHVGSGNVGGYESAWSVAAETAADGNTTAYGNGHKAINIVGD